MGQTISIPNRVEYERKLEARAHLVVRSITNEEIIKLKKDLVSKNTKLREVDQQINRSVNFEISLGGSYRGQKKDHYRQGYGELISDDQTQYRLGQWENDKIEGFGCSIFVFDGYYEYYVGNFFQGKAQGRGKLTKKDGSYYDGEWVSGEPEGKGYIVISDYSIYDGQVQKGKMHGQGLITFTKSNVKCSGIFVQDQMVNGQIQSPQGNYFGEISDGKMHGSGKFIWNDGSYYSGDFKDNCRDGFGVSKYEKSNEYEKSGTHKWLNDKQVQEVSV